MFPKAIERILKIYAVRIDGLYNRLEEIMNVLVINCGSSSLKYQLIDSDSEAVLAKGLCERIGIDGRLVYQ